MTAADNAKRDDGRAPIKVRWIRDDRDGQVETLPYREAVGALSLFRAELADKPKLKKARVSPAARKGQDGAEAGNKPPSGADDSGRA